MLDLPLMLQSLIPTRITTKDEYGREYTAAPKSNTEDEQEQQLEYFTMTKPQTHRLDQEEIDESVNCIYVTKDYSKFKFNSKNREINPAHLRNLKESIEDNNLLEGQPILVNHRLEIIDGQHRFFAAKELELPLYYIKKDGLTIDDAITLNINTRNWGYKDYLWHWIERDNQHYVYFHKFMEKYEFGYSVTLALLGRGQASRGQRLTDEFNQGKFTPEYKEYAERIGDMILELGQYGDFVTTKIFMLAFDEAQSKEVYDHEEFLHKVEQVPDRFRRKSTQENYLLMMDKIYNYNRQGEKKRLY